VRLEQTGPGRYEAHFPTKEVGAYLLNLMELKDGKLAGSQAVGASVNYSPEFTASEPNLNLLKRLAETGGGRLLDPARPGDNPFLHDRKKTFQPRDLWEWLLKCAVILFTLDVGVRRIQLGREEWLKFRNALGRTVFFWRGRPRSAEAEESLAALLARREEVRTKQTAPAQPDPDLFKPKQTVVVPEKEMAESVILPSTEEPQKPETSKDEKPAGTTGRLLEARRRAKKKME
jgi:hypothetical protein